MQSNKKSKKKHSHVPLTVCDAKRHKLTAQGGPISDSEWVVECRLVAGCCAYSAKNPYCAIALGGAQYRWHLLRSGVKSSKQMHKPIRQIIGARFQIRYRGALQVAAYVLDVFVFSPLRRKL